MKLARLRNSESSPRSSFTGIRRWDLFRDVAALQHSPPTEEAVLAWPASFARGTTRASFEALRTGFPWRAEAASVATRGLSTAGAQPCNPAQAAARRRLAETPESEERTFL